jgi:hypothetical protein
MLLRSVGKNHRKLQSLQEICPRQIIWKQDKSANFTMEILDAVEASANLTEFWCCVPQWQQTNTCVALAI